MRSPLLEAAEHVQLCPARCEIPSGIRSVRSRPLNSILLRGSIPKGVEAPRRTVSLWPGGFAG